MIFKKIVDELIIFHNRYYEKSLNDFPVVFLDKMLYLICMESVKSDKEIGLFDIFDNFVAFENGPVEMDIYHCFHFFKEKYNNDKDDFFKEIDENDYLLIKRSIEELFENNENLKNDFLNINVENLINICQKSISWKNSAIDRANMNVKKVGWLYQDKIEIMK